MLGAAMELLAPHGQHQEKPGGFRVAGGCGPFDRGMADDQQVQELLTQTRINGRPEHLLELVDQQQEICRPGPAAPEPGVQAVELRDHLVEPVRVLFRALPA